MSTPQKQSTDSDYTNILLSVKQKEQTCLYQIIGLDNDLSTKALLTKAAALLLESFRYPKKTGVALTFNDQEYATANFAEASPELRVQQEVRPGQHLSATVAHLGEDTTEDIDLYSHQKKEFIAVVLQQLALRIDRILLDQEMTEKQRLQEKAFNLARIGSWEFNMQNHDLSWSNVTKKVHGFGPDHKPNVEHTINLFKEGDHREKFAAAAYDAIENERPFDLELKIISGEGDERWIRAAGQPEYDDDGVCTRFYGISQNVTARRQAEEDLQLREQRFKSLVQDGADMIAILDADANYTYVSPTSESILGIPADDFIGTNAFNYIHEDDRENLAVLLENLDNNERIDLPPYRFIDAEDNWRWMETTLTDMTEDPVVEGLVANSRDVTKQINQQQKNLDSIKEKETLLAEIHHRVKNNLAVVSSMMQLQASEEKNQDIKDRLFDGIVRIKTMANIHEQLYQSNSFSKMEFDKNIESLTKNIHSTFHSSTDIAIDYDCEAVELNINQAIPCSLIVNEVITNVFKHAFPGQAEGSVDIVLSENTDRRIQLSIFDNGIGLPENIGDGGSLGLTLIDVLSQQLGADYLYNAIEGGTLFEITFHKDEHKGIGNHYL
jgi:PAS domain S-box-containing protein